jgi:predicted acylesterase/phospholipase RssA
MKYLVLGPGALGYFSLLGYVKSIEDKLEGIKELSGASAGAIISLFLSVGLSVDEIIKFSFDFNVPEFVKIDLGCFFNKFGFVDIDPIRSKLIEFCKGNPTFKELKKKLYVSAFCLNTSKTEYFSVDTHPDMYVIDAVCMSMSIPFIFTATTYNNKTYVDGGLIERYPFLPFVDKKTHEVQVTGIKANTTFKENIETPIDLLQSVALGAMTNREDYTKNTNKTVINVEDIDVFNFDMEYEDKLKLYFMGLNNISANIYGKH